MLVATHNGIPPTSARRIVESGRVELCPCGGSRPSCVKCTPEIEAALEEYLNDNCTYNLAAMKAMVRYDFGVDLSTTTISNKLIGMLYTTKQICFHLDTAIHHQLTRLVSMPEPMICNNDANKEKGMNFAKDLRKHMHEGNFIVYYDETNFNVYCKRSQGRAKRGERAMIVLPPPPRVPICR
jgi:hypothetical protein